MSTSAPVVPFVIGESIHKAVPPEQRSPYPLAPGRWAYSPKATAPYATVDVPAYGVREVTWGDVIEIPAGSQGAVTNTSAHNGDIVFAGLGTGLGATPRPPAAVAVPALIVQDLALGGFRTQQLDTRGARRAYLCLLNIVFGNPLRVTITYNAKRRGAVFGPDTQAAVLGVELYVLETVGYTRQLPLGMGSGQNRESPGPNSLPELRPMALLDSLFVFVTDADAGLTGFSTGSDGFFVLEY